MDVGPLVELVERLAADGVGLTLMPVEKGTPMGGWGSTDVYAFDGWEVGYITPGSGGELAVGETLAEAVAAALAVELARGDGEDDAAGS
jgi:hypothetical protein